MIKEIISKDIPAVKEILQKVLGTTEYSDLRRMGGLTNHTYKVTFQNGEAYVVRIPGEGTEELINRRDEKCSTELACRLGIDAPLLYFGEDGTKVTRFIHAARTMNNCTVGLEENLVRIANVLHKLHTCGEKTNVIFEVFDMAADYEKIISSNHVTLYDDYGQIKERVMEMKAYVDSQGEIMKVPCHNDPLSENWVLDGDERMYLIDWEYAGMNDAMWDLADVSIEAGLTASQDEILLNAYFDRNPTTQERSRFHANKIYLDYLWTLWGKARVPFDGEEMEAYALERYNRLKKNLELH